MINKKTKKSEKALAKQYKISIDKLMPYYNGAIILSLTLILCYFLNWVYVYNTDYGIEVKASGFSFIIATLSGKFYSTDKIYGDLAIPFYYNYEISNDNFYFNFLIILCVNFACCLFCHCIRNEKRANTFCLLWW